MKELDQIVLQKGLFTLIKGTLFDKKALAQSRRIGGGWISLNESYFWLVSYIIKTNSFKKRTFNEASNPWMLYL